MSTGPSPTAPPPLYLTGPARRINAIESVVDRHHAVEAAITERCAELEQYRTLYAEVHDVTLTAQALEHRDPYLVELLAIRRQVDEVVAGDATLRARVAAPPAKAGRA